MKRLWTLVLALALVLTLGACSGETEAEETQAAQDPTWEQQIQEGPSAMDEAVMLIGSPVEELLLLVGVPEKIEYYPSAMNEGDEQTIEEGIYYYSDFYVYTLKEGQTETVYDVTFRQED